MSDQQSSHLQALKCFEGKWIGEGELYPNPFGPAGITTGRWDFRFDRSGFNLIHDYSETRSGGFIFEGHGVFNVDPQSSKYVWFWFDSYGHPPFAPARGIWTGRTLTLEKVTPRGIGRSVFIFDEGGMTYNVQAKVAESKSFMPITQAVFRRAA